MIPLEHALILDMFVQACLVEVKKDNVKTYNHQFLSAYENAQRWLIEKGYIKAEECEVK